MPVDQSIWTETCLAKLREFIDNTYTEEPNPQTPPEYSLVVVWQFSDTTPKRMLVRTNIGDDMRYLVSYSVMGEEETIVIEPIYDGPVVNSKKAA